MVDEKFNSERILIGQGREANVYLWNDFAYKCFNLTYPKSLIDYEFKIQNTIYNTGLPTVKYFESEIPHSIKMNFIDGVHIGEKFLDRSYKDGVYNNPDLISNHSHNLKQNYEKVLEIMLSLSTQIHSIKESDIKSAAKKIFCEGSNTDATNDFNFPSLNPSLIKRINNTSIDNCVKQRAIKFISDIKDEKALCHMDYHFFNIMYSYSSDKYYIIDWMDAKLGNPIYDYARSYIIIYEYVGEFAQVFYDAVKNQAEFDELDFKKAIYVMAVHRLSESNGSKIKELINEYK
jgi:hypothetical protein